MPTMLPPSKTSFILYRKVHKAALTPEARPASSYGYFVDIFLSQFLYMVLDKSPVSFFCMWIFSFPSPICCKNCPFLWALAPLSRILCLDVRGFISKLSVPFHWSIYMSVYMPVPHCFDNQLRSVSKSGSVSPSALFLFVRIVLSIQGPLRCHLNFRMFFFNLCIKMSLGF